MEQLFLQVFILRLGNAKILLQAVLGILQIGMELLQLLIRLLAMLQSFSVQ
jgi:hypothetical protein